MAFYLFLKRLLGYMLSMPPEGGGGTKKSGGSILGDEMVQDPHCKVYVPLARAVSRKIGGETVHFCSEECAREYVKGTKL